MKLSDALDETFWDSESETFGGVGLVEYGLKNPFGLGVGAANAAGADATLVIEDDWFGDDNDDDFGVDVKGWCTPRGDVNELLVKGDEAIGDPKWLKPDPSRDTEWCVAAIPCGIFGYGIEKPTEEFGIGMFVPHGDLTFAASGTFEDGIADKPFWTESKK